MKTKNVCIIGVGLIGGSLALRLREKHLASSIIGVDQNEINCRKALELGLVDRIEELNDAIALSDLIILAIPVNAMLGVLPYILDRVNQQIVIDTGSTKSILIENVRYHLNRGRFVAAHPMWGTEFSGPQSAVKEAFTSRAIAICDSENSDQDALDEATDLFKKIGMRILYMESALHDRHTAYISHISHIISFALANTVLEKEKEECSIFDLASGGFESTVRLAKSNPDMWVPIFHQNRQNVMDVLDEYIHQLHKFKDCLATEDYGEMKELILTANSIRKIIK